MLILSSNLFAQDISRKGISSISDGTTTVYPYQIDITGATVADGGDGTADVSITGDITSVGDVASGAAFDGSQGNTLTFKGATSGTIAFKPVAVAGTNTITMPAETGTVTTSATALGGDATGTVGAVVVGDDSHAHTTTTISGLDISADTNLAVTAPIVLTDDTLSITQSATATNGYLSSTDWNTFNNKQTTIANYVGTVADGTGIDGTASGAGSTYTPTLDLTEINSATFGSGTFTTLTFDAGVTDPVLTFGSGTLAITGTLTTTGLIQTGQAGTDGQLKIYSEQGATDYSVVINPHVAMTQDVVYTLPADDGAASTVLTSDGAGALSWVAGGGAPTTATYITQTTDATLSAEQALSTLATGLMQVTTATGVISSVTTSAGVSGLLSDETGSGALVFGTSPTFTTKIISPEVENAGNITIDAVNAAAASTVSVTNSDATYVANLSIEGNALAATYGSDSSVTDAELLYINTLSSNAQTQITAKQGTLTNSAGLLAALNDETGTGLAVFGTSPTFTTGITTPIIALTGGQIAFPANQAASAGANTLDDYEEGTFSPDLQFGGAKVDITYSVQNGKYTKIGNRVLATGYIVLTSKG